MDNIFANICADSFIDSHLFLNQGMEIVQTMNSDPGLAVGESDQKHAIFSILNRGNVST